ncbi:hypothetical protein GCM10022380_78260 [Amycolatopsis tucumanensis]|uniref:Uncharacterized protein n=1 Tax=Amycolatopsis tucumanensis TaxID=401106 RepID=A0ABP7JMS1_9PSEU
MSSVPVRRPFPAGAVVERLAGVVGESAWRYGPRGAFSSVPVRRPDPAGAVVERPVEVVRE